MEEDRKVQIKSFMKKAFDIEINGKYIEDYDQALTHYNDQRTKGTREPERLAFLGDSYLEFIVRKYLFNHKDKFSTGDMGEKTVLSNVEAYDLETGRQRVNKIVAQQKATGK